MKRNARFIWIDEVAFNTRSLKYTSWVGPNDKMVLIHQPETAVTAICALADDGVLFSQFRMGMNSDVEFLHFLIELNRALQEANKENYNELKSKLVFVFDNASIHLTKPIYQFFLKKGIVGVTLP